MCVLQPVVLFWLMLGLAVFLLVFFMAFLKNSCYSALMLFDHHSCRFLGIFHAARWSDFWLRTFSHSILEFSQKLWLGKLFWLEYLLFLLLQSFIEIVELLDFLSSREQVILNLGDLGEMVLDNVVLVIVVSPQQHDLALELAQALLQLIRLLRVPWKRLSQ